MIKFFRQIRQRLLTENKFSKYLLYAIGEIVLVVIGILIALNINNWNEERIAHSTLNDKLKSQVKVMQADRVSLLSDIDMVTFRIYGINRVLKLANIPTSSFRRWDGIYVLPDRETQIWNGPYPDQYDREFIETVFETAGSGPFTFKLNTTVFDELIASGLYSKIHNDSLKIELNNHYDLWNSETTIKYVDVLNRWRESLRKQGALIYDVESVEKPINLLTKSPEATAALKEVMFESIWQGHLIHNSIESIDQFIQKINMEISRTD